MRVVVTLIAIVFAATFVRAQTPATSQPSDLQVVKHSWSKVRIDWDKTPFGKPTEISDVRSRRGSILEEREAREQKSRREKTAAPPRYVFDYKLTVINAGSKAIKEIEWDYVFADAATGEEFGRREFTSVENIGAGKRKELSVTISKPPTRRISAYTLGKNEREGLREQVMIVRILYDDGTAWQAH
ncbi:MAG TPA: hypothetical protein VFX97_16540 [Pyrinomonadaceae bacterium]|nr:hypothetical protein [Pyrinomonadaceae bacterium]